MLSVCMHLLFDVTLFRAFQGHGSGELDRIHQVTWKSDTDIVVLEVPQEGSKATVDSERSTWRTLLHELETDADIVDVTINNHELKRLNAQDGSILRILICAECLSCKLAQ